MRAVSSLVLCVMIGTSAIGGGAAFAHDWYIQAVDYALPGPGKAMIFQGWGHKLPLDDAIAGEKIAQLQLLAPDGTKSEITVDPGRSFHALDVELAAPGTYTLVGESVPGYYQIYRDKAGKVHHTTKALDELQDVEQVFFSCRAFQNPKTHIVVGAPELAAAPTPVQSKLEIVMEQIPGSVRAGDRLTFQVLQDGKPAPDEATYDATYLGYSSIPEDYVYKARHVSGGAGQIDLPCAGTWYVRVHLIQPAPEELSGKCKNLMYNATLTLEVGQRKTGREGASHDD